MISAVVLDVDDTLYLERDYVRSGFAAAGEWCRVGWGVEGVGEAAWALFQAGVRHTTLTDALRGQGIEPTEDVAADLVRVYREHQPEISLSEDSVAFLEAWSGRLPLAVVTDGPAISQRAKCQALNLVDRVEADRLVITAEHGRSKPDPAVFELASHGWSLPGDELVYIADNPAKDFSGPLALGWQVVRLRRPGSLHESSPTPRGVPEVDGFDHPTLRQFLESAR